MQPLTILAGDVLTRLRELPSGSVHCVVTSPPYLSLRDYKLPSSDWSAYRYRPMPGLHRIQIPAWTGCLGLEPSIELYIGHLVQVFEEVRRVLRPDGTAWVNIGDCYSQNGGPGWQGKTVARANLRFTASRHNLALRRAALRPTGGLKPKDMACLPWRLGLALQAAGWWVRSDVIWCLSGGARVYAQSQKGEMPMTVRDLSRLKPGTVKLWNGEKWTNLLGVSLSSRKGDEIELRLRSGQKISCTPRHKWPTDRGLVEAQDIVIGDVLKTCVLPEPEIPLKPQCIPDSVGWFIGIYLAEGSTDGSGTIQISSHVDEVDRFNELERIAQLYGARSRVHLLDGKSAVVCIDSKPLSAILSGYITGRVAKDKHLASVCWQRSNRFLSELLRGYLEGDGHYDRSNDRWRLGFTRNHQLASDLRTLCARLDCSLTLSLSTATCGDKTFDTFRGELRFTPTTHHNSKNRSEVVAIGRANARDFYDIGVEDEPHLFALASGVLTHNSKPNPMPESVRDRPTKAHEYILFLAKSQDYFYDQEAISEPVSDNTHLRLSQNVAAQISSARANAGGKTNGNMKTVVKGSSKKPTGCERQASKIQPDASEGVKYNETFASSVCLLTARRNKRTVWTVATAPYKEAHFATFPPKLIEPCILASTSAAGCCAICGAPLQRITEQGQVNREWQKACGGDVNGEYHGQNTKDYAEAKAQPASTVKARILAGMTETLTIGWEKTCKCKGEDVRPCVVLDPFGGSGTTAQVALEHGRHVILIELSASYIELINKRLANLTPGLPLAL